MAGSGEGTPFAEFTWWSSTKSAVTGYEPWAPGVVLSLPVEAALWVRVGARNVGVTSKYHAVLNMVAPVGVGFRRRLRNGDWEDGQTGFENDRVGVAPEHAVTLHEGSRYWPKDLIWVEFFALSVPEGGVMLLAELNDAFQEHSSTRSLVGVAG